MFTKENKLLIKELGLDKLPKEQQALQLAKFYSTLRTKIAMAIEDKLSDKQLLEFEKVSKAGDDAATAKWLKQAVPDYDEVVAEQTAELKAYIKKSADNYRKVINS